MSGLSLFWATPDWCHSKSHTIVSKPRNWLAISNIYSKSLECGINIQISCAGKSEVETGICSSLGSQKVFFKKPSIWYDFFIKKRLQSISDWWTESDFYTKRAWLVTDQLSSCCLEHRTVTIKLYDLKYFIKILKLLEY